MVLLLSAGTGKTYTEVAMAVKALKTSKTHYPYPSSCGSRGKQDFFGDMKEKLDP
jgi:hypothetical protein